MSACGDSRGAMHVLADVPLVRQERRAGVQTDAHADRPAHERADGVGRGSEGSGCGREGDEERVSLRVDLDSAVRTERVAQHSPVLGEYLRIALRPELVQEPGRPLDVREEKRDRAGREVRLGCLPAAAAATRRHGTSLGRSVEWCRVP